MAACITKGLPSFFRALEAISIRSQALGARAIDDRRCSFRIQPRPLAWRIAREEHPVARVGFGSATALLLARERANGVVADIFDRSADKLAVKINRCSVDRGQGPAVGVALQPV